MDGEGGGGGGARGARGRSIGREVEVKGAYTLEPGVSDLLVEWYRRVS